MPGKLLLEFFMHKTHYFLSTQAVEAFHFCLQLQKRNKKSRDYIARLPTISMLQEKFNNFRLGIKSFFLALMKVGPKLCNLGR